MKYDGNVADYVKSFQFQHLVGLYTNQFPGGARDKGYTVTFDNGETLKVKRHVWRGEALRLNPSRSSFNRINRYRGKDFETSLLNDSTAYIGLSTFNLDEISVDSIRDFISRHITIPHLIVDVRNNGGGDDAVLRKLMLCGNALPSQCVAFPSWRHCRQRDQNRILTYDCTQIRRLHAPDFQIHLAHPVSQMHI